jgi:hypothetical protein
MGRSIGRAGVIGSSGMFRSRQKVSGVAARTSGSRAAQRWILLFCYCFNYAIMWCITPLFIVLFIVIVWVLIGVLIVLYGE